MDFNGALTIPHPLAAQETRDRDRRHVWHPWSPQTADPAQLTITEGRGYRVWDTDGKEYVDGIGSALNATCGYGHPDVIKAISDQFNRLHHFDLSVGSHEPVGLLAERIASYLPEGLSRTLFVNSGSEGFEAALMIAAAYWSHLGEARTRVVTFSRGYHGSTLLSRTLSGLPPTGHMLRDPLPVSHVDLPVPAARLRRPESLPALLAAFDSALAGEPPMAVVVEPFLNVGGGIVLPQGFLRALREMCDARGTLLIVDEVFTGFGRTGRMFTHQYEGITPDILVTSKGLAGGYIPIGAVTVKQDIHRTFGADPVIGGLRYGHTTSGHAVACAASLATLDIVEKEGLVERAERLGLALVDRLSPLAGRGEVVDIRGLGLVVVAELSSMDAAARLITRAQEQGLLLRQQGSVVMAMPPLIIDEEGIAAIAERLERAVAELDR